MYEVDSEKFTSKPNPKKEFAQYFKESGAAAALQKAMGLLYRMPVKPTNLTEFFSQYFENGAQQLIRISLLKAELCYKRDELQIKKLKVQEAESYIKQMVDKLGLTEEDFNKRFVPARIKEKNRLSILERYFKDMESGVVSRKTMGEDHWVPPTSSYIFDPKIEISAPRDSNYDAENDCLRNVKSDSAMKEDIKELDPWGIICKGAKREDGRKSIVKDHDADLSTSEGHSHVSEEHELDDDDATSLAELFQQTSRDWVIQDRDEQAAQLHNRLLMVRQADKVRISDFMGWSPLQSREDLQMSTVAASKQDHFIDDNLQGHTDIEKLKRRPCWQKRAELITSQGVINADTTPLEPDNDAFLLDEEHLEHVYKLMETTRESFDYEFQRNGREPKQPIVEEICEPICELSDLERICTESAGSVHESFSYGEDDSPNESLGFVPGKMSNWTNLLNPTENLICPAGEYFDEFIGENGQCVNETALVSTINSKTPLEVPLARIDSSCHCVFAGIYGVNDMLKDENGEDEFSEKVGEDLNTSSNRKSGSRKERLSLLKDEATITEDTALENELQHVFKQNPNNRRSLGKKEKEKQEDTTEEPPGHNIDVFGIDLAKEVKRTILGFKPSELNNAAYYAASQPRQTKDTKIERKSSSLLSQNFRK